MSRTPPESNRPKASKKTPKPARSEPVNSDNSQPNRSALSMRELADEWGISERSVWTLVNTGKLDSFRVGRAVRIPWPSIDAYMAGGRE